MNKPEMYLAIAAFLTGLGAAVLVIVTFGLYRDVLRFVCSQL